MLDHIVYGVEDLEQGMETFYLKTGVKPVIGGRHLEYGTWNALVGLGPELYLELISIDPENHLINQKRWMGIHLLKEPKIIRWAIKSNDIRKDSLFLKQYNKELSIIEEGNRKRQDGSILKWQLTLPHALPEIEVCPFLINWENSTHPSQSLSRACSFKSLNIFHPNPSRIQNILNSLNYSTVVQKAISPKIELHIDTPKGEVIL